MVKNNKIDTIPLDGGLLCLDFVNTVPNRKEEPQRYYFSDIQDLITWGRRLKVIDAKTEKQLKAEAERQPKKAASFFGEAIAFRELLYVLFWHISAGKKIPMAELGRYNDMLKIYFPSLQIKQLQEGFKEEWILEEINFKRLLAPVLNDSYETLLSDKLIRIKECSSCGWLFYDTTKNGKRRWCSMKSCGSNVKALEWYHRQKKNL
ncbi:MAG TPA: CGNR zinc finger domain-containing protein [Chitinophagaceae bacterium]|nr:CGNR zinc finger domain-containing protein [Chitinophagaceae bacterium]